jgi:predicted NBD/HSP70 family sugar kinase
VRSADGLVHFAPNLGWTDVQFVDLLSEALSLPVMVGNDADLGVLAEHLYGAAVGSSQVAYVGGTVGIGGGFLVHGLPLRGAEGYAGEVGHLIVDSDGAECRCGSRGCWETKIGSNRLLSSAGRLTGGGLAAVEEVVQAAVEGDDAAGAALDDVAYWLGFGLRALVRLFNPEVIVLGGTLGRVFESRGARVLGTLHERDGVDFAQNVSVRAGALGSDGPLLGAAEVGLAPLLADPVSVMSAYRESHGGAGSPGAA